MATVPDPAMMAALHALCTSEQAPKSGMPDDSTELQVILRCVPATLPLQLLIAHLGEFLTNDDGTTRRRATGVVAALLEHVHSARAYDFLLEQRDTVRVLVNFFIGRLGDYPSVLPSLRALLALLRIVAEKPGVYPTAAVAAAKAIFSNVNTQAMDQAHRQNVFDVLEHILSTESHASALVGKAKATGSADADGPAFEPYILDFASGFVQAMDGEKDPRCLLVCLRCAALLLSPTGPQALGDSVASLHAELIDVTSCYFPVTFTPPPNDPHGITKEQLVQALRSVFAAHPALAVHVMPLLLEKLASPLPDAKRDALGTLRAVCPVYGPEGIVPHLMDVCSLLRKEVTQARDRESPPGIGASMSSLWTRQLGERYAAWNDPRVRIGVTAGAIGLNFSGAADVHVNSGYGLYVPLSVPPVLASPVPVPLVEEALHTISIVTRTLSLAQAAWPGVGGGGRAPQWWTDYTAMMVRTGVTEMERAAESLLGRSCARILCAFASASHVALRTCLDTVVPSLTEVYTDAVAHCRHAVRASVLACLAGLMHAVDPEIDHPHGEHPLSRHVMSIVLMCSETVRAGEGGKEQAGQTEQAGQGAPVPRIAGLSPLTEARCIAAAGLCDLCVRPPTALLQLGDKRALVTLLTDVVLDDEEDSVVEACLRALCTISSVRARFCDAVLSMSTPRLLRELEVASEAQEMEEEVRDVGAVPSRPARALYALSQLCSISALRVQLAVLPQLVAVAVGTGEGNRVCLRSSTPSSLALSCAVMQALARLVSIKVAGGDTPAMDALLHMERVGEGGEAAGQLLVPLLASLVLDSVHPLSTHPLPTTVRLAIEQIFRTVAIGSSAVYQDSFRAAVVACLLQGTPDAVAGERGALYPLPPAPWFAPLAPGAPMAHQCLLPIFLKVVACARRGAPTPHAHALVRALCTACLSLRAGPLSSCLDAHQRSGPLPMGASPDQAEDEANESGTPSQAPNESAGLRRSLVLSAQTVGAILNRLPAGEVELVLQYITGCVGPATGLQVVPTSPSPPALQRGLLLTVWVGKGLAMRGHTGAGAAVDVVVQALAAAGAPGASGDSAALLTLVASGLSALVQEAAPRHPFSREAGATVLPTYKQRMFAHVMGMYAAQGGGEGRLPLLLGLCSMAAHLPPRLLATELDRLLPVAVQALERVTGQGQEASAMPRALADAVALSALTTLRILTALPAGGAGLTPHLLTLVPSLLRLATYVKRRREEGSGGPPPVVRATALDCLRGLVAPPSPGAPILIPYARLHPVRQAVITGLLPALDDPKRPVRRRAAATRSDWITMSGGDPTKHR